MNMESSPTAVCAADVCPFCGNAPLVAHFNVVQPDSETGWKCELCGKHWKG